MLGLSVMRTGEKPRRYTQPIKGGRKMSTRKNLFVIVISLLMSSNIFPQGEQPIIDLSQLNFEITGTKLVNEIKGLMGNKLSANEGNKLVVVTLKGTANDNYSISLNPSDFTVVYEKSSKEKKGKEIEVIQCGALAVSNMWLFAKGIKYSSTFSVKKHKSIIIEIAVSIEKDINEFSVRYPTVAKGKAIIPSK